MKNPTFDTVAEYDEAIARCTEGLAAVSVGACTECEECVGQNGSDVEHLGPDDRERFADYADEGYFSWRPCELCGSPLGGTRYPAHALIPNEDGSLKKAEMVHLACCYDCLVYFANGDLPEHLQE